MPKVLKKYLILLIVMLALIVGAVNMGSFTSKTTAAYKTIIKSDNTATIAKWDITTLDKDGTDVSMLGEGFKLENTDSSGKWLFEIANKSDVKAMINKNSKIRIRLDSDNFKTNDITGLTWNFLYSDSTPIVNPIIFKVQMYDGGLNDVLTYKKDDVTISYNEYMALEDKTGYEEVISSSITKENILTTSSINSFKKGVEDIGLIESTYFYFDFDLNILTEAIIDLGFDKNKTFLIEWKIDSGGSGSGSIDSQDYQAYYQQTNSEGLTAPFTIIVDDITYYIGYKLLKSYEYFNYICETGYGDEPSFVFPSLVVGSTVKVRYSSLSKEQINLIKTYPSISSEVSTEEDARKYMERKSYEQYTKFKDQQDAFIKSLGYLDYGLSCKIIFDIKVDQVN